eukprot:8018086-Alexandrium_andersonii.AAC.1
MPCDAAALLPCDAPAHGLRQACLHDSPGPGLGASKRMLQPWLSFVQSQHASFKEASAATTARTHLRPFFEEAVGAGPADLTCSNRCSSFPEAAARNSWNSGDSSKPARAFAIQSNGEPGTLGQRIGLAPVLAASSGSLGHEVVKGLALGLLQPLASQDGAAEIISQGRGRLEPFRPLVLQEPEGLLDSLVALPSSLAVLGPSLIAAASTVA